MLSPAPIAIGPDAVDELRTQLRIENGDEDALAAGLIGSAGALCEQFTGRALVRREFGETLAVSGAWTRLSAGPVQAIVGVDAFHPDGTTVVLASDAFAIDIDAGGEGWVRITGPIATGRVRVRYQAGLAADWAGLPEALRHGVVRLAAHLYAQRDRAENDAMGSAAPPAAVTALWRPWRRLRLG